MRSFQSRLAMSLFTCVALVGYFTAPAFIRHAQAGRIFDPSQFQRNLTAQRFAAEAKHIGALRGVDLESYVRRFSALGRRARLLQAGPQSNGQIELAGGWSISPAGKQSNLGDFPVTAVLSPDGSRMLVVNSGAGDQSVQVVNTADSSVLQTIAYYPPHSAFIGAAYSPDGKSAYTTGGAENVIHAFSVAADGTLTSTGDIPLRTTSSPGSPTSPYKGSWPSGVSVSADGKKLYVADQGANDVSIVDVASKTVTATVPVGTAPYTTLVNPRTGLVYVSNWGDGTVSLVDPAHQSDVYTIPVGNHPSAMTLGPQGLLFVADSNSDTVSVINTSTNQEINRIDVMPDPTAPLSSSPQGIAASPDGKYLYVALAGDNAVAQFSVRADGAAEYLQGWIPTASYPTDVVVSQDGGTLYVTNGFGMGEHPNNSATHPDPTRKVASFPKEVQPGYCSCTLDQFSGTMNTGTLSTAAVPSGGQLTSETLQVARNDHFFDSSPTDRSAGSPIPVPGGSSPIKHVIYIVKENRTYDQVFGDESVGNGDPSLTLFPKSMTPNLHALAERFGVLDNFYADAQVSADGHNWTLSANASDYTEKLWPQDYSPPPGRVFSYPFESGTALPLSPGGYLWDAAAAAGISYRDYGLYALFNPGLSSATLIPQGQACAGAITHTYQGVSIPSGDVLCFAPTAINPVSAPNLVGHVDPHFINYDMRYPDVERVAEWKREFDQFVANNNLPQLEIVRLSSDHTSGTTAGAWTPQHLIADNDAAVGQLVDAVSHSSYWASTAIFVVEDDAQNGPDHVDSHRTEALVISPYTSQSKARAESAHYDTAAMVRTIELILGLKPLSQYDATAAPMWPMFGSAPDTAPYSAIAEGSQPVFNSPFAYGARESAGLNFALPDYAASGELNRILWHAIKGADVPYPEPSGGRSAARSRGGYAWGSIERARVPLVRSTGLPMPKIMSNVHR